MGVKNFNFSLNFPKLVPNFAFFVENFPAKTIFDNFPRPQNLMGGIVSHSPRHDATGTVGAKLNAYGYWPDLSK